MPKRVSCAMCGMDLEPASTASCPNCGANIHHIGLEVSDRMELHDSVGGAVGDPTLPSRKRKRVRFFSGDQQCRSSGDWIQKQRVIDRDNDWYEERVVDKATGELLHEVKECLSEHKGHGSDK